MSIEKFKYMKEGETILEAWHHEDLSNFIMKTC